MRKSWNYIEARLSNAQLHSPSADCIDLAKQEVLCTWWVSKLWSPMQVPKLGFFKGLVLLT